MTIRPEILEKIQTSSPATVALDNLSIKDYEIAEIMTEIYRVKPDVQSIYLSKNQLNDPGAINLAEQLRDFSQLQVLDLQFNNIGKEGALAVFSLKAKKPHLTIAFHGNQIENEVEMEQIAEQARFKN